MFAGSFKDVLGPLAPFIPALQKKFQMQTVTLAAQSDREKAISAVTDACFKSGAEAGYLTYRWHRSRHQRLQLYSPRERPRRRPSKTMVCACSLELG